MKGRPARLILAFYPGEALEAEQAFTEGIKLRGVRFGLISARSRAESWCQRYEAFRLEGESLLIAQCDSSRTSSVVQVMQSSGSPAIFVLQERLEIPPARVLPTEPLGGDQLRAYIREVARLHGPPSRSGKQKQTLATLRASEELLDEVAEELAEAARLDHALTAAAEWLLDNGYLIRMNVAEVLRHLPREHYRLLPALVSRGGRLRVYELAKELSTQTDNVVNETNVIDCLREYQTIYPLTIAELWIFPLMLRLALMESLAALASRVRYAQRLREAAYFWANRLATGMRRGQHVFEEMLQKLEKDGAAQQPYFVTSLAEQLHEEESALGPVQRWIEEHLHSPLGDLVRNEHFIEAAERISIANGFGSLRGLSHMDINSVFEQTSLVEAELQIDPAGVYPKTDFSTRDQCRRAVEDLSRNSALEEIEIARLVVKLAAEDSGPLKHHVGYYLLSDGLGTIEAMARARPPARTRFARALRRHATTFYLSSIFGLTACFLAISLTLARETGVTDILLLATLGILALFPLSELAIQFINALVVSVLPPNELPKMSFKEGIPESEVTLVVVPMMLSSVEVVKKELEKLEVRYLGNLEPNLYFSLFSDFLDAPALTVPTDDELLRAVREGITDLNRRYPGQRFLLFHRGRTWSESEQLWIGRERKRGKIEDLNAYLCGEGPGTVLDTGALPASVRYVITLDADTQLPAGTARQMVETIAHPLNRVEIDPIKRVRKRGFTIVQPRVSISLPGATATRFTRVFSDTTGTDPYCHAVSDAYQDLFGEALFHGKAIYDVRAFHTILGNRFPPETLLSHDLIEGAYVGVGLSGSTELFETLPLDYSRFSKREHRWIRGDWQIAPWIWARVPSVGGGEEPNPLTSINRWRIFDNLRRSLVPVASLLLLVFGWLISAAPHVWSLVVGLAVAIPALAPVLERFVRRVQGTVHGWRGAAAELIRALVLLALLPHQAWLSVDAIIRVYYRRWISHRNLLEWETAEMTHSQAVRHVGSTLRQLLIVSATSIVLMIVLQAQGAFAPTSLFVALWILSPAIVRWLGHPGLTSELSLLSDEDQTYLRRTARLTWRFFDDLIGPENHWLPPDNSQMALRIEVATRTSPTNIGFWLTSALAGRDFGYLTTDEFERLCSETMSTLERLERYEGHPLNWYDTRSLDPLLPRYVSTVDSGNLLASLWVFEYGCREAQRHPLLTAQAMRGLSDTLRILAEVCGRDPSVAVPLKALRRLLRSTVHGHELIGRLRLARDAVQQLTDRHRWQISTENDRNYWVRRLARELECWTAICDRYLLWTETLAHPPDEFLAELGDDAVSIRRKLIRFTPSLFELAFGSPPAPAANHAGTIDTLLSKRSASDLRPQIKAWLDQVAAELEQARSNAMHMMERLTTLAERASSFSSGIDMSILYDKKRRLFGIGYAVGGPIEFPSHYDLLASECRLTSFVAVAKGDVPIEHWFALGRAHPVASRGAALYSWSGTMFEYLMPNLFTRSFRNSLLDSACRYAVQRQIEYGNHQGVPWGISEAAYSALDANQIYQYHAFGVPGLGLKPGLEKQLVVAPYATVLALLFDSEAAIANLRRLDGLEMQGPMGFYEAIDFTRQNTREGERGVIIYTYMAHHQGMSLLAIDNVLHSDAMQSRFHHDLRIRAVESLLFEGVPVAKATIEEVNRAEVPVHQVEEEPEQEIARTWKEDTSLPRVHLYGNGTYSLMLTNGGTGSSRWNDFDVSRWRADGSADLWGTFIYLRDFHSGNIWSVAYQPLGGKLGTSIARFAEDRAEFHRRVLGIDTSTEITVAAEDDVEIRRVTLTNRSIRHRQLELTSYLELALAPHAADRAHPVFSKMFVETELHDTNVLIAHRRPRSPEDPPVWAAHVVLGGDAEVTFETNRREFLGRGNTASRPDATWRSLTGSLGAVLDPVFSLRLTISVDPRERREFSFLTIAASSKEALLALVDKYRREGSVARALEMAWTRAQLQFRYLGITASSADRFQELAGRMIYPTAKLRAVDRVSRNHLGQRQLWAYGISGDLPILTVLVADPRNLRLVRELLLAHTYWRLRGFRCDFLILNQEAPHYDRPLHQQLKQLIEAHSLHTGIDKPGGVFLRDWSVMPEAEQTLLLAASSVVLSGTRGSLRQQLAWESDVPIPPAFVPAGSTSEVPSPPLPFLELPYFNGLGGFTPDGRQYATYLKPGEYTPVPWCNVISNERLGTVVSESGLGFTWFGNSQSNRLTPWHNDPVSDPQSEVIYLRDEDSGAVWTPTPSPVRENDAYRARHGQGYTVFEHNSHAIVQEVTVFVPVKNQDSDPIKICRLRLRNESGRLKRLTAVYFAEWVLGSNREDQQLHVNTSWDADSGALLARNPWNENYAGKIAFAASNPRAESYSGDRAQFLGRYGSTGKAAALDRTRLDNRVGAAMDAAAGLELSLRLDVGEQVELIFMLGEASSIEDARNLIQLHGDPAHVEATLNEVMHWWDDRLGVIEVKTPVLSTNLILNRWLLYQTLSCRFWARSAFYQSGGAFGFRDQLQDSLALIYTWPELTRAHILRSAARQFSDGDVQHWWHPETGNGVRTRCSDDLLWLPYAVTKYVEITGDQTILEEQVPFLDGPRLEPHEQEKLFVPNISTETAPIWEHCLRAVDQAWKLGPHGLPLFGNGDWNDGMNRVGAEGKGESIWLAWFMYTVSEAFEELLRGRPFAAVTVAGWRQRATELALAVEQAGWDGEWYLRGYFDDGSPLGSARNTEARIDSLPQSWAVISGAGSPERSLQAMQSAMAHLVRDREKIILLFTPPFDHSQPHPGYIMGYPPGLRENGGQYTHGSLWYAMAWARLRDGDTAVRLLQMLNPVEHSRNAEETFRYRGEPYVAAADVSAAPNAIGQCGWSWYTGSAGWMYRVWLEEILGFRLRGDHFTMDPVIPSDWPGFDLNYRYNSTVYQISVQRHDDDSVSVEVDGRALDGVTVPLVDDKKTHRVIVRIPQPPGGVKQKREAALQEV